jgi:hypothetical protein
MSAQTPIPAPQDIPRLIYTLRDQRVILDSDLARIYGIETRALNQAVKRNQERFPPEFVFALTPEETRRLSQIVTSPAASGSAALRSQIVISKPGRGGRRYGAYAFTEHGALMAATVLNSPQAVKMSLFIIRAFVKLREDLASNAAILRRLAEIDKTLLLHDAALREVFQKLQPLLAPPPAPPRREIGFHVQEGQPPPRAGKKAPRP